MNVRSPFSMKRVFSLLEVMIAVVLLAIAASVIGIRTSRALDEKRFQTAIDRLFSELESCRRLAINMQADWNVIIESKNDKLMIFRSCPEVAKSQSCEWKALCSLRWNHEPIEKISFLFSSTGKLAPSGVIEIIGQRKCITWNIPQLFLITEGSDGAMIRPNEKLR